MEGEMGGEGVQEEATGGSGKLPLPLPPLC
jgi:hypothetical protein